jgi:hypothetical protein
VLAEFLIDKRGLVPAQLKVADVYSDTMVDIKDVLALVMYLR